MLTGELNPLVYSRAPIIKAVHEFLTKDSTRIRILFDGEPNKAHKSLDELIQQNELLKNIIDFKDKVDLKLVPKNVAELYDFHFLVADQKSYRFEDDRNRFDAIAQFDNSELGKALNDRFDEVWAMSSVVTNQTD